MSDQNKRYAEQMGKVAESGELILLQAADGLFAMFEDDQNNVYIPVWAEKDGALRAAKEEWQDYEITTMELSEYHNWVKELNEDGVFIGAFPDEQMSVVPLKPTLFSEHILEARKNA